MKNINPSIPNKRQSQNRNLQRAQQAEANGDPGAGASEAASRQQVNRNARPRKLKRSDCVLLPQSGKQDTPSRAMAEGQENGGHVSISPPSNIPCKYLLSGIDSLSLAIDVQWQNSDFFTLLDKAKAIAKECETECPLFFDTDQDFSFMVSSHGSKGYAWLLQGKEYALKIGDWLTPGNRPSVMVEIRSETLWRYSPSVAVQRILIFLENQAAKIIVVKPSRLDLCLDLLLPVETWTLNLLDTAVTRSAHRAPFFKHQNLTGIQFGKGDISARLYDKALEINQKSKKFWFYDLWKIDSVPDGFRAIRVEFQLRRGVLKTLGLDTLDAAFPTLENIWAYCSQKWLAFHNHPERQYHHRPLSPWWQVVQNSFLGIEQPTPLIRAKAISTECHRLARQAYGYFISLLGVRLTSPSNAITSTDLFDEFIQSTILAGKTPKDIVDDVAEKVLKLYRSQDKVKAARQIREQNGFPCNLPKEDEP